MAKIMLINVTHAEETRVGIISGGVLESFQIEAFSRTHQKGNIYKGVLHRVHPALEAGFVDIGSPRHAFLPLDEICFRNLPGAARKRRPAPGNGRGRRRIQDVLKPGTELLVQIVKEEFGSKPPTLTTYYSLPGRYLVLTPGSEEAGISRRIEGEHRARLRGLIANLNPPEGCGIIVRTAAGSDEDAAELERDLAYLTRLWENIQRTAETKTAPCLVYREHDLVIRNIRDYYSPDLDEIIVDNEEAFHRAREFVQQAMPDRESTLRLYQGSETLFSHFGLETQIESIFRRRVQLPCGGSIVIDPTEALTAIDVNSGGSTRGANQEQTAYKTNKEAAVEIARQLRLRDLGGLLVIDFIDMRNPKHNQEIEQIVREAMREDKARHDIGHISRFGMLEISRQRLRPSAAASSYVTCPMCEGHGLVRTTESAALVALRKIQNLVARGDLDTLKVTLPQAAALYLMNQKRQDLLALERSYGTRVLISASNEIMAHQSLFDPVVRAESGEREVAPGEVAPAKEDLPVEVEPGPAESPPANGRRRGRRRRRRGRPRAEQPTTTAKRAESQEASADGNESEQAAPAQPAAGPGTEKEQAAAETASAEVEKPKKKRRRPGARRRKTKTDPSSEEKPGQDDSEAITAPSSRARRSGSGKRRRGSSATSRAPSKKRDSTDSED